MTTGLPRTDQPADIHTRRIGEFRRRMTSEVGRLIVRVSDCVSIGGVASTYSCLAEEV